MHLIMKSTVCIGHGMPYCWMDRTVMKSAFLITIHSTTLNLSYLVSFEIEIFWSSFFLLNKIQMLFVWIESITRSKFKCHSNVTISFTEIDYLIIWILELLENNEFKSDESAKNVTFTDWLDLNFDNSIYNHLNFESLFPGESIYFQTH